jgi:hypothetical protein
LGAPSKILQRGDGGVAAPQMADFGGLGRLARKTEIVKNERCTIRYSPSNAPCQALHGTHRQIPQRRGLHTEAGGAKPVPFIKLNSPPFLHGNPSHRSVCPCTVSHLLAPAMSRTYVIRGRSYEAWPPFWLREVTRAHRAVRPDPGHRRVLAELVSPNQPVSRAVLEQARSSTWLKACAECAAGREPLSDVPL